MASRGDLERSVTYRCTPERVLDLRDVARRNPPLGDQRLLALVPLPQVQRRKDDFFLADEGPPRRDRVGNLDEFGAPRLVRVVQDRVEVFDPRGDFAEFVGPLVGRRVDRKQVGAHGCKRVPSVAETSVAAGKTARQQRSARLTFGNLADLVEEVAAVRKDDEGVLAELLVLVAGRVGRRSGRGRDRQDRVINLGGLCVLKGAADGQSGEPGC